MKKNIVISLDGHSGCGKSTLAKKIAEALNYIYIDTGAMYRAVSLYYMEHNLIDKEGKLNADFKDYLNSFQIDFTKPNAYGKSFVRLNGKVVEDKIRTLEVSNQVSEVSKYPLIREKLVNIQQQYGKKENLVMDGRDIGTVVFPNADIKFWVKASADKRAMRRWQEFKEKGEEIEYQQVLDNINSRDYQDLNREVSPLKKPTGAIEIDTSNITIQATFDEAMNHINKILAK